MTPTPSDNQWPPIDGQSPVRVPTPSGDVFVQIATPFGADILVITSPQVVAVPIVRFQSACVFGEGLRAKDCDCGVQLEAAIAMICKHGGIITYAWEEGRGIGIAGKLKAIALQQANEIDTAAAFDLLGYPAEPRTFDNHVAALTQVFEGREVRLASRNPAKIDALVRAGLTVTERFVLEVPGTPERDDYLARKIPALGHHR